MPAAGSFAAPCLFSRAGWKQRDVLGRAPRSMTRDCGGARHQETAHGIARTFQTKRVRHSIH